LKRDRRPTQQGTHVVGGRAGQCPTGGGTTQQTLEEPAGQGHIGVIGPFDNPPPAGVGFAGSSLGAYLGLAMNCPYCRANKDQLKVIDSRGADGGEAIRRRRECLRCEKRFTTYERIEPGLRLTVVKKDGRREPWDRQKILAGLNHAAYKRPIPEAALQKIADDVEETAQRVYEKEVPSGWVGEQSMTRLRELDQVAYVRFASVYREFKTVEDLMGEIREVMELRSDEADQPTLFDSAVRRRSNGKRT
jgi:transcriptional repressor NrdR